MNPSEATSFDLGKHRSDTSRLTTLHHKVATELAGLLETELPECLAVFLSTNNRQLGYGTIQKR